MKILKFGGTSLKDEDRVRQVADIILAQKDSVAVVVSAFAGVTDRLIRMAEKAAKGDKSYLQDEKNLEEKHISIAKVLIDSKNQSLMVSRIILKFNDLHDILHGIFLVRELSPRMLDVVMSFGERLSAFILANVLHGKNSEAYYLDARSLIRTNRRFGKAGVDYQKTFTLIRKHFNENNGLPVITGFIGATSEGETTTLGRSGSDFTASIFGAALKADEIQIWTDVNGVLTADPAIVTDAFTIPDLSYEEAMELSHFGAEVVHPATMQPALEAHIPIRIKNTLNPQAAGTVIGQPARDWKFPIKSLSSVKEVALVNVIGSGMIGETGIAGRIFSTLAREKINIILITQASSEHSVCFAVSPACAQRAKQALEKELKLELLEKRVNRVQVESDLSIIAVVGENMRRTPGIAGQVFQALGRQQINISAIAQGSSELNISLVIARKDLADALNAIHQQFFNRKGKS